MTDKPATHHCYYCGRVITFRLGMWLHQPGGSPHLMWCPACGHECTDYRYTLADTCPACGGGWKLDHMALPRD